MSGLLGGGTKTKKRAAGNVKQAAAPTDQITETAKRNKRLKASALTQGFAPPTLAKTGLLGVSA